MNSVSHHFLKENRDNLRFIVENRNTQYLFLLFPLSLIIVYPIIFIAISSINLNFYSFPNQNSENYYWNLFCPNYYINQVLLSVKIAR